MRLRPLKNMLVCSFLLLLIMPFSASAQVTKALSISLEDYNYPYKVDFLNLNIEGQDLKMAYMDVNPGGKGDTPAVLLLHGKNFFGAYWQKTIRFLSENGFRVIVPDQIGFGKSAKPNIHYSFHLLAFNTKKLLDSLGVIRKWPWWAIPWGECWPLALL